MTGKAGKSRSAKWRRGCLVSLGGAAVVILALVVIVRCTSPDIGSTTRLSAAQLSGTWVGPSSATVTFHRDRSFTSSHLKLKSDSFVDCAGRFASGDWGFYKADGPDGSDVSPSADSGSEIGMTSAPTSKGCDVDFDVRSRNGHVELCATGYADDVCGMGLFFRKAKP